ALPVVTRAGTAAALYSITRIPGWAQPYLLGWTSMLGLAASVGAAVGLAAGASGRWRPVLRAAGVAAVATALGLAALGVRGARAQLREPPGPPDHLSEWVRLLADPAAPELRSSGARRYLVEVERTVPRAVAVGLILALDKAGVPLAIAPFGPFRFEGRLAPDGSEDAALRVGAESSAWTGRAGARMLSREGGVFLYLLPGPPAISPASF
ncbi:MAG TPA: hypothetical protein VLI67_09330, partial [Vicinamibacteria bacterium]|nr:hypothetical protein [Vicinamibacteria bacterium]